MSDTAGGAVTQGIRGDVPRRPARLSVQLQQQYRSDGVFSPVLSPETSPLPGQRALSRTAPHNKQLCKLLNTGGLNLPAAKPHAEQWPKPAPVWDTWYDPDGRPATPRTQAMIDENTKLRWEVAEADAGFAQMECVWQKKREEFSEHMTQAYAERAAEIGVLLATSYPHEKWGQKQRYVLICFTEWKTVRYAQYTSNMIGKVAQSQLLPMRDMLIKISWMAWKAWNHERLVLRSYDKVTNSSVNKNCWISELVGTLFRLWRIETVSAVFERQKIYNSGNMMYHAQGWFRMMRTWTVRRNVARSLGEKMGKAMSERLVERYFEIWKRWDANGFVEVCDKKAFSLHAVCHRCFTMWATWTWSAMRTPGWSDELIALQKEIPKVRLDWENKVQRLEDKLAALRRDNKVYTGLSLPLPETELERVEEEVSRRLDARQRRRADAVKSKLHVMPTSPKETKRKFVERESIASRDPLSPKAMLQPHQSGFHRMLASSIQEVAEPRRKSVPSLRQLRKDMTVLEENQTTEETMQREAKHLHGGRPSNPHGGRPSSSLGSEDLEELGIPVSPSTRRAGHYPRLDAGGESRFRSPQ